MNSENGIKVYADQVARVTGKGSDRREGLKEEKPWEDIVGRNLQAKGERDGVSTTYTQTGDIMRLTYDKSSVKMTRGMGNFDVANPETADFHYDLLRRDYNKKWLREVLRVSPQVELYVIDKRRPERREMVLIGKVE
jgi:hypothetical protein